MGSESGMVEIAGNGNEKEIKKTYEHCVLMFEP